jgi:hypothetical protein
VAPVITTTTLPNGTIDVAYNQQLAATGTQPITWSIISGNLPTNLTLSPAGIISGTPMATGTFNFTVQASNSAGNATKPLSITINGVAPVITTSTLPGGLTGTTYSTQLAATGTTPITWSLESENLPDGLTLSAAGVISGTPTSDGISNFTVKATNSAGSDTKSLSIAVTTSSVAPTITTAALPDGKTNTIYSAQLESTGTAPIIWSLASGNLPTGLTLYSGGSISGTPTTTGTFNFTVQATNSAGHDTKILTIKVEDGVGILENKMSDIRIYPNPTIGKLKIESENLRIEEIIVFDIYGRMLKVEWRNEQGERAMVMDISELSVGVYFLRIKTEQGEVMRKVLKE